MMICEEVTSSITLFSTGEVLFILALIPFIGLGIAALAVEAYEKGVNWRHRRQWESSAKKQ